MSKCINCSPNIKLNTLLYIANYKINEDINNDSYLTILEKYFNNDGKEYNNNIKNRLRLYIKKNPELVETKIQHIYDCKNAIELNKRYCELCRHYFNDELQLITHKQTKEHLSQELIFINNELNHFKKEYKKYLGLYENKCKAFNKLQKNYNKLEFLII